MRVCILTRSDLFPTNHGAAVKIMETAYALSKQYKEPVFFVLSDRDAYMRVDGRKHTYVPYPKRLRAMEEWFPISQLDDFAEYLCHKIGYPKEEFFLYAPQFAPSWILRALYVGRRENIGVFQAEFPGYGVPAAITSYLLGLYRSIHGGVLPRSVIVQHNVEWDRLAEFGHQIKWIRQMERLALQIVDDVIAVSRDDKRRMVAAGIAEEKITIIPHGVDLKRFSEATGAGIRARYSIAQEAPLLLFHGTLHYWPNTEAVRFIVQKILPVLYQHKPELKILICGMNPPRQYQHEAIIYTDSVEDLEEHIASADVCICPLFAGGGTRLKLIEYMAAKKAIVSTTKGAEGIPFHEQLYIADGVESMCMGILELLENKAIRKALERRAYNFVKQLDWGSVTQAYTKLYAQLHRGRDWTVFRAEIDIESHLPERIPSKDRTLLLLINKGCNLRCSFCDLWEGNEQFPIQRIPKILDDAVAIDTKVVVITGGEPLLHKHIFTIIKEAKDRGLSVNMTTNGTLVERYWEELCNSGIDSLSFSIDGLSQVHDELRGQNGAFEKTQKAILRVRKETNISCSVYFVATNKNVHQLTEVFRLTQRWGCSFDFWPVNDAPDLYIKGSKDVRQWREAVDYIAKHSPKVHQNLKFYEGSLVYHNQNNSADGQAQLGASRCLGLIDQYGITYDGWLLPCCVWGASELRMGNVFERSLSELWYSREVQKYRKTLFEKGCKVGCFNHSLYEFQQSTGLSFVVD